MTGRKLLLADDSVTVQKVVALTFSDEGMHVVTVSDGEQALAKLEEFVPDIVLADVHMPKLSGYEVCKHIKQDERFRHIPVMLLVGSFEPFDEGEARRVGADDHLTKPFQSIRQLIGKVGGLLGGRSPEQETPTLEIPVSEMDAQADASQESPHDASQDAAYMNTQELELTTADTQRFPHLGQSESEEQPASVVEPTLVSDEEEERAEAARLSDFGGESLSDIESQQATLRWPSAFEEEAASAAPASEAVRDQEQESFQPSRMEESREEAYARAGVGPQINASVSDEALLDLGEIETPSTVAAPEDFILDLQDEAFYHEPQPEETAPRVDSGNAAVVVEEEAKGTMTRAKEFVEGQTIGTGQQFEITQEIPNADVMEAEPVLEAPQAATGVAATGESAVAEPPAARTGLITLDQLSPEVIDAIARRAVEQLSEKVVQEIAWEVVPQLAELLIKRRLEEEKAQPQ